jgi:hypothetical protein
MNSLKSAGIVLPEREVAAVPVIRMSLSPVVCLASRGRGASAPGFSCSGAPPIDFDDVSRETCMVDC